MRWRAPVVLLSRATLPRQREILVTHDTPCRNGNCRASSSAYLATRYGARCRAATSCDLLEVGDSRISSISGLNGARPDDFSFLDTPCSAAWRRSSDTRVRVLH